MSRESEIKNEVLAAAAASQLLGPLAPVLAAATGNFGIGRHEVQEAKRTDPTRIAAGKALGKKPVDLTKKDLKRFAAVNAPSTFEVGGWCVKRSQVGKSKVGTLGGAPIGSVVSRRAGEQCYPGYVGIADQSATYEEALALASGSTAPVHAAPARSAPTGEPMGFDISSLLSGLSPLLGTVSPGLAAVAQTAAAFTRKGPGNPNAGQLVPPSTYQQSGPPGLALVAPPSIMPPYGGLKPQAGGEGPRLIGRPVFSIPTDLGLGQGGYRLPILNRAALEHIKGFPLYAQDITPATPEAPPMSNKNGTRMSRASTRHPFYATPGYDPRIGSYCPRGYHLVVGADGTTVACPRNRRMNPLNPSALRRAGRRLVGFQRAVKRVEKILSKIGRHKRSSHSGRSCFGRKKSCR